MRNDITWQMVALYACLIAGCVGMTLAADLRDVPFSPELRAQHSKLKKACESELRKKGAMHKGDKICVDWFALQSVVKYVEDSTRKY